MLNNGDLPEIQNISLLYLNSSLLLYYHKFIKSPRLNFRTRIFNKLIKLHNFLWYFFNLIQNNLPLLAKLNLFLLKIIIFLLKTLIFLVLLVKNFRF